MASSSQVLFLFGGVEPDSIIVKHLSAQGIHPQTTSSLAQAMNWIHASRVGMGMPRTLHNTQTEPYGVIVADVNAGGISLAEYALEQYASLNFRPVVVLIDNNGDVNAARRAIRMSVDAYLLSNESAELKQQCLDEAFTHIGAYKPILPLNGHSHTLNSTSTPYNGHSSPSRLSAIENAIFNYLNTQQGLPVSARAIVNMVMGRELDEEKAASLLRPHISRLRSKLEPTPQMPQHLLTVRGKGYMVV